jgi:hypothetical protein
VSVAVSVVVSVVVSVAVCVAVCVACFVLFPPPSVNALTNDALMYPQDVNEFANMLFDKLEGAGSEVASLIRKTFGGSFVNQVCASNALATTTCCALRDIIEI